MQNIFSQINRSSEVIDAIDRLTGAVERLGDVIEGLGPVGNSRYTSLKDARDLADEPTMAEMLRIKRRTLAKYRRQGKLPACWIKNGRQVRWHVYDTLEAWKRGVA